MPPKPAYPDPLPDGPADHTGTDCVDNTGNLVTRNPGEGKAGPLTFDGQTVTVATPQASTRIRTSPCAGSGISRSTRSRVPPACVTCTARIFAIAASFVVGEPEKWGHRMTRCR
jgi:hypothetical protein